MKTAQEKIAVARGGWVARPRPSLRVWLVVGLILAVGAGCVTRTTTRGRNLSELTNQTPDENPRKVRHKTLWIWQSEFWHPEEQ